MKVGRHKKKKLRWKRENYLGENPSTSESKWERVATAETSLSKYSTVSAGENKKPAQASIEENWNEVLGNWNQNRNQSSWAKFWLLLNGTFVNIVDNCCIYICTQVKKFVYLLLMDYSFPYPVLINQNWILKSLIQFSLTGSRILKSHSCFSSTRTGIPTKLQNISS